MVSQHHYIVIVAFWINSPTRVFNARDGVPELTTMVLTECEVRDLAKRILVGLSKKIRSRALAPRSQTWIKRPTLSGLSRSRGPTTMLHAAIRHEEGPCHERQQLRVCPLSPVTFNLL